MPNSKTRVFLDTNVVLTGALDRSSFSGRLTSFLEKIQFLHSAHVLKECNNLISRDAPTDEIRTIALEAICWFLDNLQSEVVENHEPPNGLSANDPDDNLIFGSAIAANADVLCTYNIKDFPEGAVVINTPISIHRTFSNPELEQYIQTINLSSQGTLLFFGRLHHPSSMGPILISSNGVTVTADETGLIQLSGTNVKRHKALKPLLGNEEFRLSIRYKETDFEAALWTKKLTSWTKEILSNGVASFSEKTSHVLFFVPNHQFSGHIQCISGIPRYVKDKQLYSALDNYSLEAIEGGSLNLKWFLVRNL